MMEKSSKVVAPREEMPEAASISR